MGNISELYLRKFLRKVEQYNQAMQLPEYFGEMIGDKKEVLIAEIGSGPVNTIGDSWPKVKVTVLASDVLAREYKQLWRDNNLKPRVMIWEYNMEKLMYPDNTFDIVHCRNAVDHTKDAYKAISEMKRVCKPGGWVYLAHGPSQKKRFKGHHYWNFEELNLPEFEWSEDAEGLIVCKWQKI